MIECPNCNRSEGVHSCSIISIQKTVKEIHYHCELCNSDWTDADGQQKTEESVEKKCYWCSHYISVNLPNNPKTSMVIGLNNGSGNLIFVDPTFCPICGKPIGRDINGLPTE